jgi:hypothetical protein
MSLVRVECVFPNVITGHLGYIRVAGTFDSATWSFPGELCGAQSDGPHGFVSTVAEDRYKAALESETRREIRGAGGNSVDAAIACLCQEQGGQRSSLAVPTDPPLVPRLYPHIALSPLYMFERPYLSVSWSLPNAVCAADFSVDSGPEIGTIEYI